MKSSTRLDSAIFQLTPTRTRCDLLVTANGKTEKIASGLVNPFLAHLKTAKDQVDKGGYSIILKPEVGDDSTWFTKGTIERFVRFVSTPEVLERVYTIETEIIQIKEAIRSQNNSDMVLIAQREDNLQAKKFESMEGSRPLLEANEEKAIILYQPGSHPQQANGSTVPEENSKAHVLKVLETRKTVLQKEQGMAFARAVAAGFDIDDMVSLISFSRNFGASRLMDACVKFMDLWKKKHESGQWVEIAATEVMSIQPDNSAGNDSGIVLTNAASISHRDSWPGTPENNDVKSPADGKPNGHQEYLQGQLPHPMYSPWPVHSPPGAFPVFQGYPMQGIPPYPSYPGSSPYPSSYPSSNDPRYSSGRRKGRKHHSSNSEDSGSEDQDTEVRSGRRRKSGKVVIRNINYISSKKKNHSGTESDDENNDDGVIRDHLNGEERVTEGTEADSGHWQAFQTYLLADADKDEHNQMMEKEVAGKKRQSSDGYDPLVYDERDVERYQEGDIADIQSGNITRRIKGPNDEWFISRKSSGDCRMNGHPDAQYIEVDGKRVLCRKNGNDDFMIRQRQHGLGNSSDPLALNGFDSLDRKSSCNVDDDSYIVPLRSPGRDESGGNKRNAIDIGSEIPSSHPTDENERKRGNYEPHDLSLMPERGTEKLLTNYDPALDFGLETRIDKKKDVVGGAKKAVKDPRSRLVTDAADKRKASGPIRKGRSTKMSPLDEARARAEKLRTFKADLMKMKKEKEEEERKRIEALKMARQKRIAARSNSSAGQSQQVKKPLQNKFSPSTHRGSKFSDSEPGSSSPLQRFPVRTASLTSNDSQKLSKNSKLSNRSNSTGKKLTRSVSSLPLSKKDNNITSLSRTRRLSEPKMSGSGPNSSVRSRGSISSKRVSSAPESKKISAIVNYDKTKIASLPELKIKTSAGSATGNRSSTEVKTSGNKEKSLSRKDIDESPVIEKTVVMLEREKPSVSVQSISSDIENLKIVDTRKKPEIVSECVSIRASISSEPMETSSDNANVNDIVLVRLENLSDLVTETPKFPTSQSVTEKPYEAPYARVSSLENSSTGNYSWASPTSIPINEHEPETVKVLVPESKNTKLEKITEPSDKVQTKESTSKGLMKLLKFGRKTQNAELDNAGVYNRYESNERAVNASASSEAFTLKNLISEEETPIASAGPHKSSRHFSLLLPFKNKSTEKKITS